jgi:hypothetical protein
MISPRVAFVSELCSYDTDLQGIQAVFLTFSLSLVATRLIFRWRRAQRLFISDGLVISSWLCSLAFNISAGIVDHLDGYNYTQIQHVSVPALKALFAMFCFFDNGLYFSKASLIAYFFRPTAHPSRRLQYTIYGIAMYTAAAWTTEFLLNTLWCLPISNNWYVYFIKLLNSQPGPKYLAPAISDLNGHRTTSVGA